MRHHRDSADAVRITTAPTTRSDDIAARQRRYLVSMGIRTLCVIGAVVVGPGILRWAMIAGAIFLPYVAVVMANAAWKRADDFTLDDVDHQRPVLGPPEDS